VTTELHLVRAKDVIGLPVVTIDGGEDAAQIRDVVYDAERHHLLGFTLNERGWFRGTLRAALHAEDVVGIGADAVMVADESCLTQTTPSDDVLAASRESYHVIGDTVVSSGGATLGEVVDVVLETGSRPKAVGYEVKTGDGTVFVPSSVQMAVSENNLVVPAEAEEFTANDLAGFGAAVQSFRHRLEGGESS
jgi:uncharacterized protein YrrD